VFRAIRETEYSGYVGLEYWPLDPDPIPSLSEVARWLQ
jgi:hydroxypyruvate isomerase